MQSLLLKLYKSIISPYLAVIVIIMVILGSVSGALLDSDSALIERSWIGDFTSGEVFSSKWFLGLNLLLLVITFLCTIKQTGICLKRQYKYSAAASESTIVENNNKYDEVTKMLKKFRYHAGLLPDGQWIGYKNKIGFAGAPLFHLGIVIIVFGIMADIFAGFTGYLALRPGIVVEDNHRSYINLDERPLNPERHGRFSLLLHKVGMFYNDDGVSSSGEISVIRDGRVVTKKTVDKYEKIRLGLISLARDTYGYYMYYRVLDEKGITVIDHAQGLNTADHGTSTEYSFVNYRQPGTSYRFTFNYYPDVVAEGSRYTTRSYEENNPAVHLVASYEGKPVYNGLVRTGQEVTMDNGHRFVFRGTVPYLLVRVQWLFGATLIAVGSIVFLTGLVLYYFFLPSIVTVRKDPGGYRAEFTAWTGREGIKLMVREIEESLNGRNHDQDVI